MANFQSDPVYALPHLYISGMDVSIASTSVLSIAQGQCRDINNVIDIAVGFADLQNRVYPSPQFQNYSPALYLNAAVNGANGLDQGTIAASSQYAVYIIADSAGYNHPAGLISLASNANPLMPAGFDSLRLLSFVATDSSAHFVYATNKPQFMSKAQVYGLSPAVSVLSGGNATSFAGVDCNSACPAGTLPNVILEAIVTFIPASASDMVQFRPTGSSATAGLATISAVQAGVAQTAYYQLMAGVNGSSHTSFDYQVSNSSAAVSVSIVQWTGAPHQSYPV